MHGSARQTTSKNFSNALSKRNTTDAQKLVISPTPEILSCEDFNEGMQFSEALDGFNSR
jgi:hypothetical protein